jgi:hypothetical protein
MTGIAYQQTERRFSTFIKDPKVLESFEKVNDTGSELIIEPAAKSAIEGILESRHSSASMNSSNDDSKKKK